MPITGVLRLSKHLLSLQSFPRLATNCVFVQTRQKTYRKLVRNEEEVVKVTRDVLIYVHRKSMHVAIAVGCLLAYSVFLTSVGMNFNFFGQKLRSKFEMATTEEIEAERSKRWFFDIYKFKEGKYHKALATAFYVLAVISGLAVAYIPARYVKSIVLMKDNSRICLSTYAPFGTSKHILVASGQVKAVHQYLPGSSLWVKVGKYRTPFYISKTGQVLNDTYLREVLSS